jgi:hypothetical protein
MLWDWDGTLASTTCSTSQAQPPRSQSERQSGSKGGSTLDPQGFDAAKKVTGRKGYILVDTLGLLLNVVVHSAAIAMIRIMLRRLSHPTICS